MMLQIRLIISFILAFLSNIILSLARDLIFPLIFDLHSHQVLIELTRLNDGIDIITGSDFASLTTFANLPYANCFVDEVMKAYDVAILRAPFDTISLLALYISS